MTRPTILLGPLTPETALRVFANLDLQDRMEAELMAGRFNPWDAVAARHAGLSVFFEAHCASVLRPSGKSVPFAIICLAPTGYPGCAMAEFLSCNHTHFARELIQLVIMTRDLMPEIADKHNLNRIEFRCWADHPSAGRLGRALGFRKEADLAGYGGALPVAVEQWAWTRPDFTPHRRPDRGAPSPTLTQEP